MEILTIAIVMEGTVLAKEDASEENKSVVVNTAENKIGSAMLENVFQKQNFAMEKPMLLLKTVQRMLGDLMVDVFQDGNFAKVNVTQNSVTESVALRA